MKFVISIPRKAARSPNNAKVCQGRKAGVVPHRLGKRESNRNNKEVEENFEEVRAWRLRSKQHCED